MENARLTILFQRYINRSCTEEEKQELLQLIAESDDDEEVKMQMDILWARLSEGHSIPSAKAEKILHTILTHDQKIIPIQRERSLFSWRKVAASIAVVLFSVSALLSINFFAGRENDQSTKAPTTEHRFIKLPDGSTVLLNAGSKLDFPESFEGKDSREVILTGEAYFDIRHDDHKPFIVHTGALKTTVLGTAFNIKAYPTEKSITVTVTRGKVKVSDDLKVIGVITPNQQITFDKVQQQAEQQTVDSRNTIAWADRDIFFDDSTLEEVAIQLAERFKVDIRFRDEQLKSCRFTATFIRGEDLEQILNVICEFNGARYYKDEEGNIEIAGEGCGL
jgi:ferric-dicitrate binding protein FerR (iron transport regulator)